MKTASKLIPFLFVFILAACSSSAKTPVPSDTPTLLSPSPAPTKTTTATSTSTPIPPTPTQTPTPSPPPCSPERCIYPGHFWLERPISPEHNDQIDTTYRYGSTQEGARPTHHGVEFVNPEGTPVLAAADGTVIVAGNDFQETYADYPFYYGNLVIIEHDFPEFGQPVFTLYGHLSQVDAQVGDAVKAGDPIGLVGYTGIAEWSHLHFEVRVEKNLFRNTRNPELWLKPHADDKNGVNGAIAGRIIDEFGGPIHIPNVVVERLDSDSEEVIETIYVETYADFTVHGDDEWGENFTIGDLLPGKYRVTFVARGLQTREVEVYPGQLTLVIYDANQ